MPKIGLSRPYVAIYVNNSGVITYQNGRRMGRAVELSVEIDDSGNDNGFYADNGLAETLAGIFTGGTLTMTTAELEHAVSKMILGLKTSSITVDGQTITELVFDEDATSPNLGFGVIIKNYVYSQTSWTAVIFKKVAFSVPGEDVTTQGEEVDWQTQETSAKIMRDDSANHQWQVRAENLATEELADKYIRTKLNMSITAIGVLDVMSIAGSAPGKTSIVVTPALSAGNKYMYRLGSNLQMPYYEQSVGEEEGFEAWDGASEITPGEGAQQILVVEATASETAVKAGIAALVVAEETEG